jgi:hypothetical protein
VDTATSSTSVALLLFCCRSGRVHVQDLLHAAGLVLEWRCRVARVCTMLRAAARRRAAGADACASCDVVCSCDSYYCKSFNFHKARHRACLLAFLTCVACISHALPRALDTAGPAASVDPRGRSQPADAPRSDGHEQRRGHRGGGALHDLSLLPATVLLPHARTLLAMTAMNDARLLWWVLVSVCGAARG